MHSSALDMARAPSGPKPFSAKNSASAKHAQRHARIYHRRDFHCSKGRLTSHIQLDERGVAFQRTRYGTCTLRPKTIVCKAKRVSKTRAMTRPHIIAETFIAARVDSPFTVRLVSVELRSSALDMARAPSGPILLPACALHATARKHSRLPHRTTRGRTSPYHQSTSWLCWS